MSAPLIEFTNLLHKVQNPDDPAVRKFKEAHASDRAFLRQAEAVELAFRARMAYPARGAETARPAPVPTPAAQEARATA